MSPRPLRLIAFAPLFAACAGAPLTDAEVASQEQALAAIPQKAWVHLEVMPEPDPNVQPPPEACQPSGPALLGELTRDVSMHANGLVERVLDVVHDVTQHPPTVHKDGHAAWLLDDGQSPIVRRFDIQAVAQGVFHYQLAAKPREGGEDAWRALFQGASDISDPNKPHGAMRIDFDVIHAFDPDSDLVAGRAEVQFGHNDEARVVAIVFTDVAGKNAPQPRDAVYHFAHKLDGGGVFDFVTQTDFDRDGTLDEQLHVQSAWQAGGAGRSHATVSGGSLGDRQIDAVECWAPGLARVFYADDANMKPPVGNPACCPN